MTKYICFEGVEGSYKTTNVQALAEYLRDTGKKVLVTKEPGTAALLLTMKLRELMLSTEFNAEMTPVARELISQAIRSVHLDKLVNPALKEGEYDYIIQDRGTLSGLSYALALGHPPRRIFDLMYMSTGATNWNIYDQVFLLVNDPTAGLVTATQSKQEFKQGDAMEAMGPAFMAKVLERMRNEVYNTQNGVIVETTGKTKAEILQEIVSNLT